MRKFFLILLILPIFAGMSAILSPEFTPNNARVLAATTSFNPLQPGCDTAGSNASDNPACPQSSGQGKTNPLTGPNGTLSKTTDIIALVAGIGAVFMIILGGFRYVTAGGNAENAAKAKSQIVSGLIGLVIVALAWTIIGFIIDHVVKT